MLFRKDRQILEALAKSALPGDQLVPGANIDTVERTLSLVGGLGTAAENWYSAGLRTINATAFLKYGKPLLQLHRTQQAVFLEEWRKGKYPQRLLLRTIMVPLKASYCSSPEVLGTLQNPYETSTITGGRPAWADKIVKGSDVEEVVECDVVVVGTGAGGAVAAYELASKGNAVVMVEEGDYADRTVFQGPAVNRQQRLWRNGGLMVTIGNTLIPVPVGKTVGGTTTINSGTCLRAPERVLDFWRREGISGLSAKELEPYYSRVESLLGVEAGRDKYLGRTAGLIKKGCDRLGYSSGPLPRNAPDCDGQGTCCFGCPTGAKRSTDVSYVPMALRAGAFLFTGLKAEKILTARGRAYGIVARTGTKHIKIKAGAVVLACGALHTPNLLMHNKLCRASGQLGRNLSIHPALGMLGEFDEEINNYRGIPQGYGIDEFKEEGLLFEGSVAPVDIAGSLFPQIGGDYISLLKRYNHMAGFGFMIEDSSRGRVLEGREGPNMLYSVNSNDVALLKRGVLLLSKVFFAAGAKRVYPLIHGFDSLESERDLQRLTQATLRARDFDLTAYHPLGTARLGPDPRASVVGLDHRTHEVLGLYIVDGSSVPSSLGVNPQLTIMALATRAAEFIDSYISR